LRFGCFKIDKVQRHQYSTFDVPSFKSSKQAEFHASGNAATWHLKPSGSATVPIPLAAGRAPALLRLYYKRLEFSA